MGECEQMSGYTERLTDLPGETGRDVGSAGMVVPAGLAGVYQHLNGVEQHWLKCMVRIPPGHERYPQAVSAVIVGLIEGRPEGWNTVPEDALDCFNQYNQEMMT